MKNAFRMVAAVVVLFVASEIYAQAPPFSLKLDVTPSNAKTGSSFFMEVDLTNTTKERKELAICLDVSQEVACDFAIYVRDSHGNSLPEAPPPLVSSLADTSVEPGQTIKFFSDLSKLFDLSRPDRYEIQVERGDAQSKRTALSNVVHISVSAQ